MRHALVLLFLLSLIQIAPAQAHANTFERVEEEQDFLQLMAGKELRLGLFGIRIRVLEDGQITGTASGWDLSGSWAWQDGYFCREIDWSGTPIPYNCQLVEYADSGQMRFTVDQGAGDNAVFNLR